MQDLNINYSHNKAELLQIIEHLQACDNRFVPPLSTKVSIHQYSQKIVNHAIRFEAFLENQLVGFVACYLNDQKNHMGFITSVSVLGAYKGMGIAKKLIEMVLHYARENGFKIIYLEVNKLNVPAMTLYKNLGFVFTGEKPNLFEMSFKIN